MRIARYTTGEDPAYGVIDGEPGDEVVRGLRGDPLYIGVVPDDTTVALEEVRLLAPVIPRSKVIGIGRNYADHAAELGNAVPDEPLIFLKPSTSVIGPGAPILIPPSSSRVEFEGELAVVIGRPCRDVKAENAQSVILGYTVANDVTARDLQRADVQFTRGKSFDSFCPIGPWIETELDPTDVEIRTELDDEVKQDGHTSDMVHSVAAQIEYISAIMTLLPGDIILTGTPAGVGQMVAGQTVSVTVEGIGTLTNPVLDR